MMVEETIYMGKPCMIWQLEDEDTKWIKEIGEEIELNHLYQEF